MPAVAPLAKPPNAWAVTIKCNHRWTQINTDQKQAEPRISLARVRFLDSEPEQSEARPEFGPQNLCSSVFICGLLLPDYLDRARFRFERGDVEPESSSSMANANNSRAPHRQIALL